MSKVQVRMATAEDIPPVCQLITPFVGEGKLLPRTLEEFDELLPNMFVAELDGRIVGIVHLLFHRSTSRLSDVCYLQDLFTEEACRGQGVGRALIQRVLDTAKEARSSRVYWTTQTTNVAGRALYDKMAEHRGFIVYSHEL